MIDTKIPILSPDNYFLIGWDVVSVLYVIINFFYTTIMFAFFDQITLIKSQGSALIDFIEYSSIVILIIEILLNFNTGYYHKGVFIHEKKKVLIHYLENGFIIDVFVFVSYMLIINSRNMLFNLMFLVKVIKIKSFFVKVDEFLQMNDFKQGIFNLFKVMLVIIFVAHFCACLWSFLGETEIQKGNSENWITFKALKNDVWYTIYIYSLYWSTTTMLTVGYGDVTPQNSGEIVFVTAIMMISTIVFGYLISRVGIILQDIYRKDSEFNSKIYDICYYLKKRKVDKNMQMRIRRYMEYMYEEEKNGYSRGGQSINLLSSQLKNELKIEIYGKLLQNIPFLKFHFSKSFLERLSSCLEELTYAPDEIIYKEDDDTDKNIFYVIKGGVELTMNNLKLKVIHINEDESFGERSFVTSERRDFTAKSTQVTNLIRIRKDMFLNILKEFPDDYESFCMLRDNIQIYGTISLLQKKCPSCEKNGHTIFRCPLINYIPSSYRIISKHNLSYSQTRKNLTRTSIRKKYSCLNNIKNIQKKADMLISKHPNYSLRMVQLLEFDQSLPSFTEFESSLKKKWESSNLLNNLSPATNTKEFFPKYPDAEEIIFKSFNRQFSLCSESKEEINFNHSKLLKVEGSPANKNNQNEDNQNKVIQTIKKPFFYKIMSENKIDNLKKVESKSSDIEKNNILETSKHNTKTYIKKTNLRENQEENECFETMKNFKIYFPKNNIAVIKSIYNRQDARKKSIFALLSKKYRKKEIKVK